MNERVKHIVINELEALKQRIASNIVASGQNASGRTIASLKIEERDSGARLLGRMPFGTLEAGRKSGKVPGSFIGIIGQWMRDKGIKANPIPYIRIPSDKWQPKYTPQQRGDISLAGAIAYKIKKEGTKLHRSGGKADVYSNEIPLTLENIRKQLSGIFTSEIQTININAK